MPLGVRIFLVYFLFVGLTGYFVLATVMEEIRPGVRQSTEETLVDTANLLAEILREPVKNGTLAQSRWPELLHVYGQRQPRADIWGVQKQDVSHRIYVTDRQGIVLLDSTGGAVGQDYSRWNDVYLTLRGEYGARSTREDPNDEDRRAHPRRRQHHRRGHRRQTQQQSAALHRPLAAAPRLAGRWADPAGVDRRRCVVLVAERRPGRTHPLCAHRQRRAAGGTAALPRRRAARPRVRHRAHARAAGGKKLRRTLCADVDPRAEDAAGGDPRRGGIAAGRYAGGAAPAFHRQYRPRKRAVAAIGGTPAASGAGGAAPGAGGTGSGAVARARRRRGERSNGAYRGRGPGRREWGGGRCHCDRRTFPAAQALANLIDNAIDFTKPGGSIRLDVETAAGRVTLRVRNQGDPIPDYALARVTERFYSLPRPGSGRKSTGLGLNFVQEVAVLHGGDLAVANCMDGVEARLTLPSV